MLKNFLLSAIIIAWIQGVYLVLAIFAKVMNLNFILRIEGSNFDKFSGEKFAPYMMVIYFCILLWITAYKQVKRDHLSICVLICACGWFSSLFLDNSLFGSWPFLSSLAILKFNTINTKDKNSVL